MPQAPLTVVKEEPLTVVSEEPTAGPAAAPAGPEPWSVDMLAQAARTTSDPAVGALKGAANTVIGLGEAAYDYIPGVSTVADYVAGGSAKPMYAAAREMVQPEGAAQQAGYTGEQVGEFFLPLPGAKAKLAKTALEAAKAGVLTQAQTADPLASGVSAALTAVVPGAAAVTRGAGALKAGAEKTVTQALGATKEWAKAEAAKLAPEMLRRGVKGSREAMAAQAATRSAEAGRRLGAAYQTAAQAGQTVPGLVIRGELQFAKDGLMVADAAGKMVPIPGAERVLRKLDVLEQFVETLGDDIPVDKAAKIKTAWDRIVAKSGLYGPKAASTATDSADAWAIREGAGSFRQLLNSVNPDIAALNKEYSFWIGLKKVLKATELRTQAQSGGLMQGITTAVGGGTGFASGDSAGSRLTNAFVGAAAGRNFIKLVQSPWWRTSVSGPLKNELAGALASGSAEKATAILGSIISALPSQARQALR